MPRDAFGNDISARTNVLDVAAHYPYSPERWRLFADGSRIYPEYEAGINDLPQYTHDEDTHDLSPAAGETVTLESAERPRYVVAYELAVTWAFQTNQSLTGNDRIRIGAYDGTDGWYLEHRGDHPDDMTGDAVLERAGSEIYREEGVPLREAVTTLARAKLQTGWYEITRQDWERSYSNDGDQENSTIVTASVDDALGPRTGNLPIHFSVTADASTSDLVLSAGSAAQVNLGTTTPQTRTKPPEPFEDTVGSTGAWVPLRAFRVDPNRQIVNTQLKELTALSYTSDATVTVAISAFPNAKVSFSGGDSWETPSPLTPTSSVIETRSDISTIVDRSGASASTATEPGAFALSSSTLTPTGKEFKGGASSDTSNDKRNVPRDDIAVAMGKAGTTGDVLYATDWEEDW